MDPYGRTKASSRNRDRKRYSRSSSSGSGKYCANVNFTVNYLSSVQIIFTGFNLHEQGSSTTSSSFNLVS